MRSRIPRVLVLVLMLAPSAMVGACFYDFEYSAEGGSPDSEGGIDGGATDTSTNDGGEDAPTEDVASDTLGDGITLPLQCKTSQQCAKGTYCAFLDHQCGAGVPGVC